MLVRRQVELGLVVKELGRLSDTHVGHADTETSQCCTNDMM